MPSNRITINPDTFGPANGLNLIPAREGFTTLGFDRVMQPGNALAADLEHRSSWDGHAALGTPFQPVRIVGKEGRRMVNLPVDCQEAVWLTHPEKEWIISTDAQAIYILWGPKGELCQAQRTRTNQDRIYWLDKIREKERKGYVEHARFNSFRPGWVHTGAKAILNPRLQGPVPLPPDGTKGILREVNLVHGVWQKRLRLELTDTNKLDHFEWSPSGTIPANPK